MSQDESTGRVMPHDATPEWGQSLYHGAVGIALRHIADAHARGGGWDTVHEWASTMIRRPIVAAPGACGLYEGAPAVAFVLNTAGRPAYTNALNTLDAHITALTRDRLAAAHQRIDREQFPALREFDLISGITGLGVYLLQRQRDCGGLLRDVLTYLVRLTKPLKADGDVLPGWWSNDGPELRPSPISPGGHGNFGMAHGIAGPLALLSACMRRGITVPGQAHAIDRICSWMDQWRSGTGSRAWWPEVISRAEWRDGTTRETGPGRPSWCYGTPGKARAQQLAALALADVNRQEQAQDALTGCLDDRDQLAQLTDASMCHGWAGLIQTTWRVASDADSNEPATYLPRLRIHMEEHLRRHGPPAEDGLMVGVSGIRLARLTATGKTTPDIRWDSCLLLDG